MESQMIIRVEPGLKNKVSKLAKAEGKNLSELVRELLLKYTKERDMGLYIDNLWDRIGLHISSAGQTEKDVEKVIKQVRSKNA